MLVVQVKETEGIEKAIKKLKKKFDKTGILHELRRRQAYIKPSKEQKEVLKRARHRQRLAQAEE